MAGRDAGLADPISANLGKALMKALQDSKQNLMNAFGVVKMRITHDDVKNMQPSIPPTLQVEFLARSVTLPMRSNQPATVATVVIET